MALRLTVGRHTLSDVAVLLDYYEEEVRHGPAYYRHQPTTDPNTVTLEDLGAAVLLEGQPRSRAARTLVDAPLDLRDVPDRALHETTAEERDRITDVILQLVGQRGSGFGSSLATKVLHKKRPATIPILDNQAVFATLCSDQWQPGTLPRGKTARSRAAIAGALATIHGVVTDPRNINVWSELEDRTPFTRVEVFDMVWWAFVRRSWVEARA